MILCPIDLLIMLITPLLLLCAGLALILTQSRQAWIAFDQWLHCRCYREAMADETFSARCWRESADTSSTDRRRAKWARRVRWIDCVFGKGHCHAAFESELNRKQLPPGFYHG